MSKIIRKSNQMSIYQINNLTQEQKKKTFVTTYVDQETHRGHGGKKPKKTAINELTDKVNNLTDNVNNLTDKVDNLTNNVSDLTKIVMQLVQGLKDTNAKVDAGFINIRNEFKSEINNLAQLNNLKTE